MVHTVCSFLCEHLDFAVAKPSLYCTRPQNRVHDLTCIEAILKGLDQLIDPIDRLIGMIDFFEISYSTIRKKL